MVFASVCPRADSRAWEGGSDWAHARAPLGATAAAAPVGGYLLENMMRKRLASREARGRQQCQRQCFGFHKGVLRSY